MENRRSVILDAGHGGAEPGAMYQGRREKDDTLRLALAVGEKLENRGVDVMYARTTDVYDSPLEKAQIANRSGADLFVSLHRNAMPVPGTGSGAVTLVYEDRGIPALLAENIQQNLVETGFKDLGIQERGSLCSEGHRCRRYWWRLALLITRRIISCLMRILTPLPRGSLTES